MRSRRRLGHQTPSLLKRVGAPEERRSVDTKHGREERERGGADGSASPAGGAAPQPASANQHNQRNQRQHHSMIVCDSGSERSGVSTRCAGP